MKNAVIFGASGLVGGHLLHYLLENDTYEQVLAVGRSAPDIKHHKLRILKIDDLLTLTDSVINSTDDVFCTLGTTIRKAGSQEAFKRIDFDYVVKAATVAAKAKATHFLLVSALGADAHSSIFYNRVKGQTETAVIATGIEAVHIFRPSLLLGNRKESRIGETVGKILAWFIAPFLVGSFKKYKGIQADDVAKAMYLCAQIDANGVKIHESDEIAAIAKPH